MATETAAPVGSTTGAVVRASAHVRVRRAERLLVALVTVGFGLLLLLWAALVPTFQAPDERAHFDAAVHVAIGDGWPAPGDLYVLEAVEQVSGAGPSTTMGDLLRSTGASEGDTVDQMTQHPPTYYAVAAGLLHLVHFEQLTPSAAVFAVRLLGALFVLPLPALAWATVRGVTRSPRAALVGALAVLAVPELASIGASVSNDGPVMLFSAVTVWLASRVMAGDDRVRTAVALAVALGVALLWKGTALPLIPFVGIAVLVGSGGRALLGRLLRAVWVLALAAAVGAWWWAHNLVVYRQVQPDGFSAIRPPEPFPADTGPDPIAFADVSWTTIARTFWGSFGGKAQWALPPVLYETATVLALGAVLVWAFRRGRGLAPALTLALLPLTVFLLQSWTTWSSYLSTTFIGGTQGRYYFPALLAFITLSAVAWRRAVLTERGHRTFAVVTSAVAVAVALYGPLYLYASFAEHGRVRVTPSGLDVLAASSPVPAAVCVALWCAALVVLTVVVVGAARAGRPSSAGAVTSEPAPERGPEPEPAPAPQETGATAR